MWASCFIFPLANRWKNSRTGEEGRHHVDESSLQKAFKKAVQYAGLTKRATCHTLRHSFATHLLDQGYDIRDAHILWRCGGAALRSGHGGEEQRGRSRLRLDLLAVGPWVLDSQPQRGKRDSPALDAGISFEGRGYPL